MSLLSDIPWRLRILIDIAVHPKKLWHLPELLVSLQFLEWHERQLHESPSTQKDERGLCLHHRLRHDAVADDYQEMLGPFYDTIPTIKKLSQKNLLSPE
jgi:hypothetical protein